MSTSDNKETAQESTQVEAKPEDKPKEERHTEITEEDYDVLIYVANWPNRRHYAWETLLRARAIENMSYVVGVNRVGTDGNDIPYDGGSAVIDYLGADMVNLGDQPNVASAELVLDNLKSFRERFAFHKDADDFTLHK